MCAAWVKRLGAQCIGFAVEFLHQEVEAPAHRPRLFELALDLADVRRQSVEFLIDIGLLDQQQDLRLEPLRIEVDPGRLVA